MAIASIAFRMFTRPGTNGIDVVPPQGNPHRNGWSFVFFVGWMTMKFYGVFHVLYN